MTKPLTALGVLLVFACPPDGTAQKPVPSAPKFSWDLKESQNGEAPKGKLYVTIAGKRHGVATLHANPSKMNSSDFARLGVPKSASDGVSSWWAGGGSLFYVISTGNRVKVMTSWFGEELEKPEPWKVLAVFSKAGVRLKGR